MDLCSLLNRSQLSYSRYSCWHCLWFWFKGCSSLYLRTTLSGNPYPSPVYQDSRFKRLEVRSPLIKEWPVLCWALTWSYGFAPEAILWYTTSQQKRVQKALGSSTGYLHRYIIFPLPCICWVVDVQSLQLISSNSWYLLSYNMQYVCLECGKARGWTANCG
jgi:hypothetical protein